MKVYTFYSKHYNEIAIIISDNIDDAILMCRERYFNICEVDDWIISDSIECRLHSSTIIRIDRNLSSPEIASKGNLFLLLPGWWNGRHTLRILYDVDINYISLKYLLEYDIYVCQKFASSILAPGTYLLTL